ncbi:mevalonate kinase [Candidatus Daviesbacteria bacterium]|nr:mevalonate kinase [Candidatus Daviesbacteria bacterium]
MKNPTIVVSAPGKIHLLGEHSVVYGKPALLTTVDLRVTVTLKSGTYNDTIVYMHGKIKKVVESIIKKHLKIKTIPFYQININSQIPLGCGLGSSAAISAAYIAALLSFLKINWNLNLINNLTYEAEKIFHGNPSGADNSTIVFGSSIFIPPRLAKNFILINTGQPKETTKEMVEMVNSKFKIQNSKFKKIFNNQEQLVKELVIALQKKDENKLMQIIRAGEKNLESIGVCSLSVKKIIRQIEQSGGAAKICGGGGKKGPTGVLLCYHPQPSIIQQLAKSHNLDYFKTALGVAGLRKEI